MSETTVVVAQPQLHQADWVNQALQPGPNGTRFDAAVQLLAAANLPTGVEAMYDSTSAASLPAGAVAYAGYFDGAYANIAAIEALFPDAEVVSVTPTGAKGAMYIDVEPGNVDASAVPAFIAAGGLGFYASPGAAGSYSVQACIDALTAAGIARSDYRVWSAHWIGRHICSPTTCGYPQADGTQYVSTAAWDESAVNSPSFFEPNPPPPAPVPAPVVWQEWTGDGTTAFASVIALAAGQTAGSVILASAVKYGTMAPALAAFVAAAFNGDATTLTPVPSGVKLWIQAPPAPAPAPVPTPSVVPGWEMSLYGKLPAVRLGDVDTGGKVPWVRQVQLLLNAAGEATTEDGDFGPQTQASLEALQEKAELLKTGWVDPVTWEVLVGGSASAVLATVSEGSTDTASVKRIQALCETHGLQLAIDGNFGPSTKAAVAAVQKAYYPNDSAQQDGVVGPATWSLLAAHSLP